MRAFALMIVILFHFKNVRACGLRALSSRETLSAITENLELPAATDMPKALISGRSSLKLTKANGQIIVADDNLVLEPGTTITSEVNSAKLVIPSTGQVVALSRGTSLEIVAVSKSQEQKVCSVSFLMKKGQASFSSNHQARLADCRPQQADMFEVVTSHVSITPIGTKYNVDLNQTIAELNGETYTSSDEISVEKGAVKIRLVKLKKNKNKTNEESLATNDYVFEEQKPVVIKAGRKAKIKKGKKDRLADIQIVYPD